MARFLYFTAISLNGQPSPIILLLPFTAIFSAKPGAGGSACENRTRFALKKSGRSCDCNDEKQGVADGQKRLRQDIDAIDHLCQLSRWAFSWWYCCCCCCCLTPRYCAAIGTQRLLPTRKTWHRCSLCASERRHCCYHSRCRTQLRSIPWQPRPQPLGLWRVRSSFHCCCCSVSYDDADDSQDRFMENYFKSQRDHIFRAVEVLIYVFDVTSKEREKVARAWTAFRPTVREVVQDVQYFIECLDAIKAKSPNAKVFCLVHKMDLIHSDETRNRVNTSLF